MDNNNTDSSAAAATAQEAGREAARQGGTKSHLCFDAEMNHDTPEWVTALGEVRAEEVYSAAFQSELARGATFQIVGKDDIADSLAEAADTDDDGTIGGAQAYLVSLEPTGNDLPISLIWYSDINRAGLCWGGNPEWTDASSPRDAVRRFLTDEMAR